jgi:hypothetical protein
MKTKLLIIVCVMIFAGAAMVGPVAAVDATSTITGNISSYIDLTVTKSAISDWGFAYGNNVNTSDVELQLVCNYPGWTIKAYDNLDVVDSVAKPTTSRGKMAEALKASPYTWRAGSGKPNLTHQMEIAGTDSPSGYYFADGLGPLPLEGGTPDRLPVYHGANTYLGAGTFTQMPIRIEQEVTYDDPVLASGYVYKMIVTFVALIP